MHMARRQQNVPQQPPIIKHRQIRTRAPQATLQKKIKKLALAITPRFTTHHLNPAGPATGPAIAPAAGHRPRWNSAVHHPRNKTCIASPAKDHAHGITCNPWCWRSEPTRKKEVSICRPTCSCTTAIKRDKKKMSLVWFPKRQLGPSGQVPPMV